MSTPLSSTSTAAEPALSQTQRQQQQPTINVAAVETASRAPTTSATTTSTTTTMEEGPPAKKLKLSANSSIPTLLSTPSIVPQQQQDIASTIETVSPAVETPAPTVNTTTAIKSLEPTSKKVAADTLSTITSETPNTAISTDTSTTATATASTLASPPLSSGLTKVAPEVGPTAPTTTTTSVPPAAAITAAPSVAATTAANVVANRTVNSSSSTQLLLPDYAVVRQTVKDLLSLLQLYGPLTVNQLEYNLPPIGPASTATSNSAVSWSIADVLSILVAVGLVQQVVGTAQYCMFEGIPRADAILPADLPTEIMQAEREAHASWKRSQILKAALRSCSPSSNGAVDGADSQQGQSSSTSASKPPSIRAVLKQILTEFPEVLNDPVYWTALRNCNIDFSSGAAEPTVATVATVTNKTPTSSNKGSKGTATTTVVGAPPQATIAEKSTTKQRPKVDNDKSSTISGVNLAKKSVPTSTATATTAATTTASFLKSPPSIPLAATLVTNATTLPTPLGATQKSSIPTPHVARTTATTLARHDVTVSVAATKTSTTQLAPIIATTTLGAAQKSSIPTPHVAERTTTTPFSSSSTKTPTTKLPPITATTTATKPPPIIAATTATKSIAPEISAATPTTAPALGIGASAVDASKTLTVLPSSHSTTTSSMQSSQSTPPASAQVGKSNDGGLTKTT